MMNIDSHNQGGRFDASARSPILIVPYMWIGDFVRCHTVVKLLKARFPDRPVDMLATTLCAPLTDYMPGVRQAVVVDLPRKRLAFGQHRALAERLRREGYGTALIMPKTWKSALAPFLAGISERIGLFGEARAIVLNDIRFGRGGLPRMVDECASLALPAGSEIPAQWPVPELKIPAAEITSWQSARGVAGRPAVALAPGAVGPAKRWPAAAYATLARRLLAEGLAVWVVGGPAEKPLAQTIAAGTDARDLTGTDLREAILALARPQRPSPTIPASSTSPRRLARRRSAFSGRPARGTGRRSIRWRRPSRRISNSPAGPATSRSAASAITAA